MAWIPKYIRQAEAKLTRDRVSSYYWNALFNKIIEQGDYNSELLDTLVNTTDYNLGPVIIDEAGIDYGRPSIIRFSNSLVTIDGSEIVVHGLVGPAGPTGPDGGIGPAGPVGPSGNDFLILGMYSTIEDLQTAIPTGTPGDAWAIGTAGTNTIYVWGDGAWLDIGSIQGPPGIQGVPGIQGEIGPEGPAGDTSALNAHLADAVSHVTGAERISWNAKSNLALGETSVLAYRGDRGVIAYNHSQVAHQAVITGAATTITGSNLTVSRALVSDASGKVVVSAVTAAELAFVSGLTSALQAQIDAKLGSGAQAADSLKIGGKKLTVGTTAPVSPAVGDLWVDTN
jgi:hypothetical protein